MHRNFEFAGSWARSKPDLHTPVSAAEEEEDQPAGEGAHSVETRLFNRHRCIEESRCRHRGCLRGPPAQTQSHPTDRAACWKGEYVSVKIYMPVRFFYHFRIFVLSSEFELKMTIWLRSTKFEGTEKYLENKISLKTSIFVDLLNFSTQLSPRTRLHCRSRKSPRLPLVLTR